MNIKFCKWCEIVKSVDYGTPCKFQKDGYDYICKACRNEYQKQRRSNSPMMLKRKEQDGLFVNGLKFCNKCKTVLPITEFYPHKYSRDGLRSTCRTCCIKDVREWQNENPEKERAKVTKWYREHRDFVIQRSTDWVEKNRERSNRTKRQWAIKNRIILNKKKRERERERRRKCPEKSIAIKHRYRAKKQENGGSFTAQEWNNLCARFDYICLACGEKNPLTVDHVVPISKGGSSDISNIQPLCKSCNSSKRDRIIDYRLNYNGNF